MTEKRIRRTFSWPLGTAVGAMTLLLLAVCGSPATPDRDPDPGPAVVEFEVAPAAGRIVVAEDSTLDLSQLTVNTLAGNAGVSAAGEYSVPAPVVGGTQMHIFTTADGAPVMIGLSAPGAETVSDAESTAISLMLLHPYVTLLSTEATGEFLETVRSLSGFPALLSALEAAWAADAATALDAQVNPGLFQLVFELAEEAVERLATPPEELEILAGEGTVPTIEDTDGTSVEFVNPHFVNYAAGIFSVTAGGDSALQDVKLLTRRVAVEDEWAWPPDPAALGPARTAYDLGDGYFRIDMVSFDPALLGSWSSLPSAAGSDPRALATLHSTASTLQLLFNQVMTELPEPVVDERPHADYPVSLGLPGNLPGRIQSAYAARDAASLTSAFASLMVANSASIADWLWVPGDGAGSSYVTTAARLIQGMVTASQVRSFGADSFYLASALFNAEPVTYFVTQQDGTVVSFEENTAPLAAFSANPPAGIVGTRFTFDATATTDDVVTAELRFRWDFDGDGTWDTDWSAERVAQHTYLESGAWTVTLQVRDSLGLVAVTAVTVNVGGGAGTASHVILLRDVQPWYDPGWESSIPDATIEVLHALGFVEGEGPMTYEIVPSSDFATVSLTPGEDLVIVSNDQTSGFYLMYARNQQRFNTFAWRGGSLFWGAADLGWNFGSILEAGVELPGRVVQMHQYDTKNYVADPDLPLTAGLPLEMEHNFASHERFSDLPHGTTVYLEDTFGLPTLIEFNFGSGWVLMSGQPLEHQYNHPYGVDDYDLESLLERIISYFTGVEFAGQPGDDAGGDAAVSPAGSSVPSSGTGR